MKLPINYLLDGLTTVYNHLFGFLASKKGLGIVTFLLVVVGIGVGTRSLSWTWLPRIAAALWALGLTFLIPFVYGFLLMPSMGWQGNGGRYKRRWQRQYGGRLILVFGITFWIAQLIIAWWMVFDLTVWRIYIGAWVLSLLVWAFILRK
ncbi:MAG: hypothetical protein HY866_21365 [Chloroflexi bacterium]|nr:hypothetical protein [Chloroflexota bacterium]